MNAMTLTQESGMETDDRTSEIHHFQMLMKDEEMKMLKYKVNLCGFSHRFVET